MSQEIQSEFLTDLEEKLLTAMLGVRTVKIAALKIGITPHTAYNVLYKLRNDYDECRGRANVIDAQKKRGRLFKKVLTRRYTVQNQNGEEGPW